MYQNRLSLQLSGEEIYWQAVIKDKS